jgi:hypothetical protein
MMCLSSTRYGLDGPGIEYRWGARFFAPFQSGPRAHPATRIMGKGKGKAIPLQAWTDPEGSRRLRFPDFKTIGTRRW